MTDTVQTTPAPAAPPSQAAPVPAEGRSRLWAALPMLAALGLGASVFFPWLDAFGFSANAMDVRLDSLWSDVFDFTLNGAWLGPVVIALAALGVVTILLRSVPAFFYRLVAIVAIAVIAMFFRAAIAGDGFEFVQYGAYAAAGFSLLMLIPRN